MVVENGGRWLYIEPRVLKSRCKIDKTSRYPSDSQTCELKFGSWTYDGWKLDIQTLTDEADTSSLVVNDKWELLGTEARRNEVSYECCPEPYLDITIELKLKRKSSNYFTQILF